MLNQDMVDLRWILTVIRHRLWIIVAAPIVAVFLALIFVAFQKPTYQSSVTLYIQPNPDASTNNYNLIMAGEQMALTYSEVLKGQTVMQMVISQLGLKESTRSLAEKITVEPIKDTQLIKVTVIDESSDQAALLANTIAATFVSHLQNLQKERFTVSIKSTQDRLATEEETIAKIQSNIDSINAASVDRNVELTQQELLLSDLRSDYRTLQQKQQALELALSQLPDAVKVVEEAQVSSSVLNSSVVTVMVSQPPAADGTSIATTYSVDQMALTYSQMVTAKPVLDETVKEMNSGLTAEQLGSMVNAKSVPGTQLIEIYLANSVQDQNLLLANTLAKVFVKEAQKSISGPYNNQLANIQTQEKSLTESIDQAQKQISSLTEAKVQADTDLSRLNNDLTNHLTTSRTLQTFLDQMQTTATNATDTVVIAEKAVAPKSSINHRLLYLVIALGLGLALGVAAAFFLEQLDNQILTKQDLNTTLGVLTLGSVGKLPKDSDELVIQDKPNSPMAEDFRVLSANIRISSINKPLHKLLICSPTPEDGKSMIAANLAVALAQTGLKVTVVDADLRIPRIQEIFKCDDNKGLTDVLLEGNLDNVLRIDPASGLNIVSSGHIPPDPSVIFNSPQLPELFNELAHKVNMVLIDSPAILAAADTTLLSTMVDGVIVIVRAGHTRSRDAKEAITRLRQVNAPILGAVLNGVPDRWDQYAYHRYQKRSNHIKDRLRRVFQEDWIRRLK